RLRRVSRAFQTSPMPPAPRAETISYGPSRVPGARAMELVRIIDGEILPSPANSPRAVGQLKRPPAAVPARSPAPEPPGSVAPHETRPKPFSVTESPTRRRPPVR